MQPRAAPAALRHELRFTHVPTGARIAWARSGHGPPLLRAGHWMTHVEYDCESALFRPWLERLGRGVTLYRLVPHAVLLLAALDLTAAVWTAWALRQAAAVAGLQGQTATAQGTPATATAARRAA